MDRAAEYGSWYGIALDKDFDKKEDIEAVMSWTEANQKLFGFTFITEESPISMTNYFRTFGAYGGGVPGVKEQPQENSYLALAMMAKCFGYDSGSETWALKPLSVISPCQLSTSLKKALQEKNISYFTTYAGKNITNADGGKVLANEWIDTIRFRDWLKNDMQMRIFNLLVLNTKVQYTDGGITAVEGKMEEALKAGQNVGGIAESEYDEDGNEIPGYTISVPKAASLTESQKASRRLPNCRFTARLAGAIQAVDVSGNLKY